MKLLERTKGATRWLCSSQVFRCQEAVRGGGFVDWVDLGHGSDPGCIYPEITGYAVSVLEWVACGHFAEGWEGDVARRAVAFLIEEACDTSGGVSGSSRNGAARYRYTFDSGMVLKGLCAYYARTRDERVLDTMRRCADHIWRQITPDGSVAPLQGGAGTPVGDRWSTRTGPYLLKAVLALGCFAQLTSSTTILPRLDAVLERTLGQQDATGFFPLPGRRTVNLHAHFYACEGLYLIGSQRNDKTLQDHARRGTQVALALWNEHSLLPALVDPDLPTNAERSDTVAQLLRLCLLTGAGSDSARESLARRLIGYQVETSGSFGGLRFGRDLDLNTGRVVPCKTNVNTWSTLFAIQAWGGLADPALACLWLVEPWLFA